MNITQLLDRPIAYHRIFVTLTRSIKAAVLLSQAIYWQKRARQADGWWYKTAEEWEEETGLTRHELDGARKASEKYLKTDIRDVPPRLYWKVDTESLSADLLQFAENRQIENAENRQNEMPKTGKTILRKAEKLNMYAETTTENTTEESTTPDIFKLYENNIGALTPMISEKLKDAEKEYPMDWIRDAMQIAVENNKRRWNYCESILKRWQAEGKDDGKRNGKHESKQESNYVTL